MLTHIRRFTRYDWLWLLWIAGFLAIEIPAALDAKKHNTLSEGIWWFLGIGKRRNRRYQAARIAGLAFMAWFVAHVWTGGKV